jgi:predicted ribosome quality control (RQC) complex YloA/Tae2 family protein
MTPSKNFRKFTTSDSHLVLAGKSAEQNELIIKQAELEESVLHTAAPGSPFCNIKGEASRQDIKETAVFCARYSRDWKENQNNVEVHVFKRADIVKEKGMKVGTFGVRKHKSLIVKKEEIKKFMAKEAK